jgi:O-antigen ligase
MQPAFSHGITETAGILRPYERRSDPGPFKKLLFYSALIGIAAFYGLLCSVLPMRALVVPLVPILLMAALALWLLPSVDTVDYSRIAGFMLWYAGFNAIWPNYIAVDVPGLPWITPTRFALFGLAALFAYSYSVSTSIRSSLRSITDTAPVIKWSFWIFWLSTTCSIVFSGAIGETLTKYFNNQIYWTIMFLAAALLGFDHKNIGRLNTIVKFMLFGAIVSSVLAILEFRAERVIWLDHLPGFLKPNSDIFGKLDVSSARAGTDAYRVTGHLGNALYFAEFLATLLPFHIDHLVRARGFMRKSALFMGLLAVVVAIYLTGSRAGMVGLLLSFALYTLLATLRWRRRHPSSLVAASVLFAYPMMIGLLAALVVFWRRLHVMVIGGGQHQASNEARNVQWAKGEGIIASQPFGHGAGQSGITLGFYNPGHDNYTVDSYYLTLLLDYGVIGFLAFMMFFATSAAHAIRYYFRTDDEGQLILLPIAVTITSFLFIKSVASTELSMPIVIMLAGFSLGIAAQIMKTQPAPGRT